MTRTLRTSTAKGSMMALLMVSALWILPTPSQAAVVTQLDITGGSISLNRIVGDSDREF
jgi:hypothetical protein